MGEFIDIGLKVLVALLSFAGVWLVTKLQTLWPQVKAWIVSKTDLINEEQLDKLVADVVKAADQLYKQEDPTGEKRNNYVVESLTAAGVEVTDLVLAKVEAKVLDLGHQAKEQISEQN